MLREPTGRRLRFWLTGSLISASLAMAFAQSGRQVARETIPLQQIQVMAVDAKTSKRIPKARVFVLDQDGKEIAEAWTDQDGIARLPTAASERPRYLFVECVTCFITGRPWIQGQLEYRMPLMGLSPPGF